MNTSTIHLKPVMKTHLTGSEIKQLQRAISKHFYSNPRFDRHNKIVGAQSNGFKAIDNTLGLAYTSSSSFAMLSICNTEVYLDTERKYTYQCFGMEVSGFCVALCQDVEGNELYIYISF